MAVTFHQFPLLAPEIREEIYKQVLKNTSIEYHSPDVKKQPAKHGFGLAFVNKQISQEFLYYAYKHATFYFHLHPEAAWILDFRHWAVSANVLASIQKLTFVRDIGLLEVALSRESKEAWLMLAQMLEVVPKVASLYLETVYRSKKSVAKVQGDALTSSSSSPVSSMSDAGVQEKTVKSSVTIRIGLRFWHEQASRENYLCSLKTLRLFKSWYKYRDT